MAHDEISGFFSCIDCKIETRRQFGSIFCRHEWNETISYRNDIGLKFTERQNVVEEVELKIRLDETDDRMIFAGS